MGGGLLLGGYGGFGRKCGWMDGLMGGLGVRSCRLDFGFWLFVEVMKSWKGRTDVARVEEDRCCTVRGGRCCAIIG